MSGHKVVRLVKSAINQAGSLNADACINLGHVDKTSPWLFDEEDANKLLGEEGKDWDEYAKWFLVEDKDAASDDNKRFKYPVGKNGKVYREALLAIRSKSALNGDEIAFAAAGHFLQRMDNKQFAPVAKSVPMVSRMWSRLEVKSINEDMRTIEGIATTPNTDRMGDIVESDGAVFDLPLPFLWQHDSSQPIGHVIGAKTTKKGINVSIKLANVMEPGNLKDRLDEAWQSIKAGLVRGLSIGFAPLEYAYMEESGGYRFLKWSWLELSAVTIPANADASITAIKAVDQELFKPVLKKPHKIIELSDPNVYPDLKITPPLRDQPLQKHLESRARDRIAGILDDNSKIFDEVNPS